MNPIAVLKREHEEIEIELMELDAVMKDSPTNYSNLIHSFKKLCEIWDTHEVKEEKIFKIMKKEQINVPVYAMTCEHRDLRGHIKGMKQAINSGSEINLKNAFDKDLQVIIDRIKDHMEKEDEILYTTAKIEFTAQEWEEMENIANNN